MSNKTIKAISINPTLFSVGGTKTKTRKNREKIPTIKPLINPNVLKNKLLKRIKEHKQRETQDIDPKNNKPKNAEINVKTDNLQAYTDEFSDSINYLQTLSKQKKINDEKTHYERQKQKRKEALERKTLKHYPKPSAQVPVQQQSLKNPENAALPYVNIDLPEELTIATNMLPNNPIILHKPLADNVPYGILKGGTKPTYRDWTRTQRNNIVTNPSAALTIQGGGLTKQKVERESRLQSLRTKLKNKEIEQQITQAIINQPTITQPTIT